MLKVWPGCFSDLFGIWNESYGSHLLDFSVGSPLCSTVVLAAVPHLQMVVNHGHSVHFSFLRLILQFQVIFSVCVIQCCAIARQYCIIGWSKLPYYYFFPKCLNCSSWLSSASNISPKGKTRLNSDTMCYNREYVGCHIGEIGVLWQYILLLAPQLVISSNQNVLPISIG